MNTTLEAIRSNLEQAKSRLATLAADLPHDGQRLQAALIVEEIEDAERRLLEFAGAYQRGQEHAAQAARA